MSAVPPSAPGAAPGGDRSPAEVTWERLEDQLNWYERKSSQSQRNYRLLKVVELVVAGAVPVIAAIDSPAGVTAGVAAVVVVLEGINQLFQWQPLWVRYRSTAESLKHERYLYLARAGLYQGSDRVRILAERIEGLISQEHAGWAHSQFRRRDDDAAKND